jgi:hypothetical protein
MSYRYNIHVITHHVSDNINLTVSLSPLLQSQTLHFYTHTPHTTHHTTNHRSDHDTLSTVEDTSTILDIVRSHAVSHC